MDIPQQCDVLVVGGGIHGAGIARDLSGRGLGVVLVEQHDLAASTSMASSKLIHGGLRYLEQGHLRLVREALHEREVLLNAAPHLVRPLSFLLPIGPGSRPLWQLRLGLWLYDRFAGSTRLAASRTVDLTGPEFNCGLLPQYRRGLVYSDAWGDDARLVVANARDAADRGALVLTRTQCESLQPHGQGWSARLRHRDDSETALNARAVVNATGPWVARFLRDQAGLRSRAGVKLVKGSHIVVRRKMGNGHALILQNDDGRVVFAIPFEREFSLIGTTDVAFDASPALVDISGDETQYLRRVVSRYFAEPIQDHEVVWSFAGIRALYDDGSGNPSQINRDYQLELDRAPNGAPILSIFGGKLTTYRRSAERVADRLSRELNNSAPAWTARAKLQGADIPYGDFAQFEQEMVTLYPYVDPSIVRAMVGRHGRLAVQLLQSGDVGKHFGACLTAVEIEHLCRHEWAQTAEDVLYRRTKCGVHMTSEQRSEVERYIADNHFEAVQPSAGAAGARRHS